MKIQQFDDTKFYREFTTRESCWKGASGIWDIEFMRESESADLLASYYQAKYDFKVSIRDMKHTENDTASIEEYLKEARKRGDGKDEYREALLVKFTGPPCYENGHAIPIIYLKANGKDALFLANSLGTRINDHNWIFKSNNLVTIYAIDDIRERSKTGCYIDAFAFLKDAIGRSGDGYRIPNLIEHLEKHSANASDTKYKKVTKLHPRLLKTFQASNLVNTYLDPQDQDVSVNKKGDKIAGHFERYKKMGITNEMRPSYIAQKGMKMRGIVATEFYLRQFAQIDSDTRKKFISGAKQILKQYIASKPLTKSLSNLYNYANAFVNDHNVDINLFLKDETQHRSGYTYQAGFVIACAGVGALAGYITKQSLDINMLNKMASFVTSSDVTSAIIKNSVVGLFIGALLVTGYSMTAGRSDI